MKKITRTLIAALAVGFLAAPMAQAQQPMQHGRDAQYGRQTHPPQMQRSWKPAKPHHWRKGERIPNWKRAATVHNYRSHGLPAPGRGKRWVKVDNRYMLINFGNGMILSIMGGR